MASPYFRDYFHIPALLDLEFNALIPERKVFTYPVQQGGERRLNAKAHTDGHPLPRSPDESRERPVFDLCQEVEVSQLESGFRHVVALEWNEAIRQIAQPGERLLHDDRRQIVTNDVCCRAGCLIAVTRFLSGHHFSPSSQTTALQTDQENQTRVGSPETGLERFFQRDAEEAHFHSFNINLMFGRNLSRMINDLLGISHIGRKIAHEDPADKISYATPVVR